MHLIFERPRGLFKSNCNILALAWMPYYNETKFRQAQFDQHQRLLSQWAGQAASNEVESRRPIADAVLAPPAATSQLKSPVDYGRMPDFGWLAIGNIGKLIGVTLTSVVEPPKEIDGRKSHCCPIDADKRRSEDLIVLNDDEVECSTTTAATTQEPHVDREKAPKVGTTNTDYEELRPDRRCMRSNYNLRGHRDEIILVQWNEFYQKLATVDSKGNVLIWCKSNEKFTIQTPFYNRSKSVADFKWSNDGKTALICYTDSFILVGGSSGQRHWHSMLNLDDYHITCASWTPSDEQLLLGVSNGNVVLIDLAHSELTEMIVGQANIRTMCWSTSLALALRCHGHGQGDGHVGRRPHSPHAAPGGNSSSAETGLLTGNESNSAIVNRRRLSLNCALFCRHCPSTAQGAHNRDCTRRTDQAAAEPQAQAQTSRRSGVSPPRGGTPNRARAPPPSAPPPSPHKDILAIDFANNTIKLFEGGLGDRKPREIQVQLESYLMAWSASGHLLAVAGFNIYTSAPSAGYPRCKYLNAIKFYNQRGALVHEHKLTFTRYPITALAWAHSDQRLFVATGPRLHCARVHLGVPSLSLLALSCIQRHTKPMDKADVLRALLRKQPVPSSVLNWQSFNCPLELSTRRHHSADSSSRQQQQQQSDSNCSSSASGLILSGRCGRPTDGECSSGESAPGHEDAQLAHNANIANYHLPAKLKAKIDQLFAQTLRQPHDERLSLSDIAWHVPKGQQRHYCTLICYTHELPDMGGCLGHQYKAQELAAGPLEQQQQQRIKSPTSGSSLSLMDGQVVASEQYKIFILYVEYQGSLIPILKARRIGFLKPEFVIFDPERAPGGRQLQRHHKVSDVSEAAAATALCARGRRCRRRGDLPTHAQSNNCEQLHNGLEPARRAQTPATPCHSTHSSRGALSALPAHPALQDPYLIYLLNLSQKKAARASGLNHNNQQQQHSRQSTSQEARMAIERYKALSRATSGGPPTGHAPLQATNSAQQHQQQQHQLRTTLPETSELVRIRSNIWGTKFKLVNVGNRMIGARALLGSVAYKASILHLQPRQIFLNLKDMSNYCVLCSLHHHTPSLVSSSSSGNRRPRACPRSTAKKKKALSGGGQISLIDLPVTPSRAQHLDCLATPARTPSRDHRRGQKRAERQLVDTDKVLLPVGDNIRVAPKLEPNQRYQCAGEVRARDLVPPTPTRRKPACQGDDKQRAPAYLPLRSHGPEEPVASTSSAWSDTTTETQDNNNNDILTLTLDQGDRVRVEMSSSLGVGIGPHQQQQDTPPPATPPGHGQKMDDFLQANRTLKSIQTITRMIVDLSSRAQAADDKSTAPDDHHDLQSSPVKLFRGARGGGGGGREHIGPARYIPPETPVHRPHRRPAGWCAATTSQSVTNTPLRATGAHRRSSSRRAQQRQHQLSFDSECPLPSPPPSVPFRRKLSTSAKRLFDGSLRSLTGLGSAPYAGSSYAATSEDYDSEDCEALVGRSRRRRRQQRAQFIEHAAPTPPKQSHRAHQSQPCSPMRAAQPDCATPSRSGKAGGGGFFARASRQSTLDLAQLRTQVVQRLRASSSALGWPWSSASEQRLEIEVGARAQPAATKRSRWVHKSGAAGEQATARPFGYTAAGSSFSGSSSSESRSSSSTDSSSDDSDDESLDFSSSDEREPAHDSSFLGRAAEVRARWLRRRRSARAGSRHSASARDLNELGRMSLEGDGGEPQKAAAAAAQARGPRARSRTRTRGRAKKSICHNANCCCAREIALSNRPPVWNEYSQVYQLDFGGRVTQESAKNLQIDFNGNLALQFGRVDKCTYTLDYKYPFNAVQAMSIALASLTQRLK